MIQGIISKKITIQFSTINSNEYDISDFEIIILETF